MTKNRIDNNNLSKLLKYLVKETNYGNVNQMALQRFIDCPGWLADGLGYYPLDHALEIE